MRILQLCKKFPYPLRDGESVAVTFLSKALRDLGCEITLLCMNTTKHYTDVGDLPEDFDHYKSIHTTTLDNSVNPVDAFLNLFSNTSYHVERFISESFRNRLVEVLENNEFDIVQLETLYLAPYVETIKQHSDAQIVMRAHNVEHEIWDRISSNTSFLPKKWYLTHLARKLRDYEVEHLNDYDYLVALTERDLQRFKHLGYRNGAVASPIGIDSSCYTKVNLPARSTDLSMCFIGSLDWMPNIEGLNWFLSTVWPQIHAAYPQVTFHVAGRNTPESFQARRFPNVVFHGEVPDAVEFIGRHQVMIVPLFSGSGMRVKILEGMALGKVVISTSLGMEGIHARHNQELIVADSAQEFVNAIQYCDENPDELSRLGETARDFIRQRFDSHMLARRLYGIYSELLTTYGKQATV